MCELDLVFNFYKVCEYVLVGVGSWGWAESSE
ncbi:MAG: hypothetical protein CL912_33155 [Deltaproteobacteria bacterium]|nr:hypothetical protein [Deltaproteobacteria bacterium]